MTSSPEFSSASNEKTEQAAMRKRQEWEEQEKDADG